MTTNDLQVEVKYTHEDYENAHTEIRIASFSQSRVIIMIGTESTWVLGLEEAQEIANSLQKVIDSTINRIEKIKKNEETK